MGIRVTRYFRKVNTHAGGRHHQPEGWSRENDLSHQPGVRPDRHRAGAAYGADPQHSALGWANLDPRPDPNPEVQGADAGALVRQARAAAGEYAWVVIDCPPGISRVNAEAIRASNVVLIPCKPRVWDVWACEDIVDAFKLRIEPIIYGGGQQNGLRSGTLPLPLCVGMAAAAGILRTREGVKERSRISEQRDLFIRLLQNSGIPAQLNGPAGQWRHPGNANLRFSGFAAEDILGSVQPQLAASTGAACSSGLPEPSHVLRAMGLGNSEASSSIRFSFGRFTTGYEVEEAARLIIRSLKSVQKSVDPVPIVRS